MPVITRTICRLCHPGLIPPLCNSDGIGHRPFNMEVCCYMPISTCEGSPYHAGAIAANTGLQPLGTAASRCLWNSPSQVTQTMPKFLSRVQGRTPHPTNFSLQMNVHQQGKPYTRMLVSCKSPYSSQSLSQRISPGRPCL